MDWIRVTRGFGRSTRTLDFAGELKIPTAGLFMVNLYDWAVDNATDGIIRGLDPSRAAEEAAGWRGRAGAMVSAAINAGFLTIDEGGGLVIIDWMETNGYAISKARQDAVRMRDNRAKHKEEQASRPPRPKNRSRTATRTVHEPFTNGSETATPNVRGTNGQTDGQTDKETNELPAENQPPVLSAAVVEVIEHWQKTWNKPGPDWMFPCKATEERRRTIQARLDEGQTVDQIKLAVTGSKLDDWVARPKHCDLQTILRVATPQGSDNYERFRELGRTGVVDPQRGMFGNLAERYPVETPPPFTKKPEAP